MSEIVDTPIVNDAITSDDAGFVSDAGDQSIDESVEATAEETNEEIVEAGEESSEVKAETVEELQDEIEEAIEDGATEEEVQNMVEEFKLKVNGKEITKKIDLSDKEAIRRELQLAAAGQSAMQRSRELEKTYEQEVEKLMKNPWETLKELGMDPDELAEARIRSRVEEMKKSPEQRHKEQLEKELTEAREALKRQQEEAENARMSQLQAEAAAEIEAEIEAALDAHTNLPKSEKTVQRIADTMLWAMENGYDDVKVADVIPTVEAEIRNELQSFMEQLPEEMMEEYIGKKNIERLRKKRLAAATVKPNNISNVKPTGDSVKPKSKEERKKVRTKDYFRNL